MSFSDEGGVRGGTPMVNKLKGEVEAMKIKDQRAKNGGEKERSELLLPTELRKRG